MSEITLDKLIDCQQENAQLKARIARLEQAFKQMDKSLISMGSDGTKMPTINYQEMLRAFGETPQQSLVEHDCEVIGDFIISYERSKFEAIKFGGRISSHSEFGRDYIQKLRNSVNDQ